MIELFKKVLKDVATARDGVSYSMTKCLGAVAGIAMIWKFVTDASADYVGFATGMAALMVALAAKYHVEKEATNVPPAN